MEVTSFEEDCITGTISLTEETTPVLVTIPYKKGWCFQIDGEVVSIEEENLWAGVFPILELSEGTHEIVCSYVSPMFYTGLYVSLGSFVLFFLQWFLIKMRKKEMKP